MTQIDLGVLQSPESRQPLRPIELTIQTLPADVTQGVRSSAQRYVIRLLSDATNGVKNGMTSALSRGLIWNRGYLQHLFNIENRRALDELKAADSSDTYGTSKPEERLINASLTDVQLLEHTTTLALTIELKFGDGSTTALNIPISTESGA